MRRAYLRLRSTGIRCSCRTAFAVERDILARLFRLEHLAWTLHLLFPTAKVCSVKTVHFGWNLCVCVCVFFTLFDWVCLGQTQQYTRLPIRYTWSQRGTKVNGSHMVTTCYSSQQGPNSRQNPCQVQPPENGREFITKCMVIFLTPLYFQVYSS